MSLQIAISDCDAARDAVRAAQAYLTQKGFPTCLFSGENHSFDQAILTRDYAGSLDLCPVALAMPSSNDHANRLTAASILGIPQLISVGGMDRDSESTPELLDRVGKWIVERASASNGPVRIVLPMGETSEPMRALFQSIRNWVYPPEMLVEVESLTMNSREFGEIAAANLVSLMGELP